MQVNKILMIVLMTCAAQLTHASSTSGWAFVVSNGTNLYVNGELLSASHYLPSLAVGNMLLSSNAVTVTNNWGWDDLRFPISMVAPVTPNADVVLNNTNATMIFKTTADTNLLADDHIWAVAQMPHTWRTNSAVRPHIHFYQTNADQTNMWWLYIRKQPLGAATNDAWAAVGPATNYFAYSSGTLHQMARFPEYDMTGCGESALIDIKIFRDGNFGTGNVELKTVDIHYQIEKLSEIFP